MIDAGYSFGPFRLDPEDRRLTREGQPVELNARYFDALLLLIATPGRLVSKDRFHDEVWRGIPVTDEALTQCIRTLRRALDDDAAAPKYIETVPRHGYRFIAPVEASGEAAASSTPRRFPALLEGAAAALGGGIAGIVAALLYVTAGLVTPGIGAASTLMVLVSINLLLGLAAGAAVGLGVALAARRAARASWWTVAGGALGGLAIGAVAAIRLAAPKPASPKSEPKRPRLRRESGKLAASSARLPAIRRPPSQGIASPARPPARKPGASW